MAPIRIRYQSYVDYENGATYWDNLGAHLNAMSTTAPPSTLSASRRMTTMRMRWSSSAARGR